MKPLVLETSGVPAKLWVRDLNQVEGLAMEQIKRMATVPGMFKWLAIMPDVHVGKGAGQEVDHVHMHVLGGWRGEV